MEDIIDDKSNDLSFRNTAIGFRYNGESSPLDAPINGVFNPAGMEYWYSGNDIPVKCAGINLVLVSYKIISYDQEIKIRRIQALFKKEKSQNK